MKYLTVVKSNGEFSGVQYSVDNDKIRQHHTNQNESLVWLDYELANQGTEDNPYYGIWDGQKLNVITDEDYFVDLDFRLSKLELGI